MNRTTTNEMGCCGEGGIASNQMESYNSTFSLRKQIYFWFSKSGNVECLSRGLHGLRGLRGFFISGQWLMMGWLFEPEFVGF